MAAGRDLRSDGRGSSVIERGCISELSDGVAEILFYFLTVIVTRTFLI